MEAFIKRCLIPFLLLLLVVAFFFDESDEPVEHRQVYHETILPESQPRRAISVESSRLAVGVRYASLEELDADQKVAGFLRTGYFGKHWPATVVEIETGDGGIRFVRKDGTPHEYRGFDGYLMKMVRLKDSGDRETIVVFCSAEKLSR